jgi:hypothetical protein
MYIQESLATVAARLLEACRQTESPDQTLVRLLIQEWRCGNLSQSEATIVRDIVLQQLHGERLMV